MTIQKIRAGRIPGQDPDTYIGNDGQLFYDEDTGILRISDGVTPGGTIVSGGSGGGTYTLPTATTSVKGGVKIDGTTIAINNQVISVGTVPYSSISGTPTVPTNVSQLTNDTGFITGVTWDAVTGKPALFSGAYADLSGKPTNVSTFTNDSGYLTSSSLSSYATQSYVTGRGYITSADLPTAVSELTNDSGYLTDAEFDLNTIDYDSNNNLHATGILPGDTDGFTAIFAGRAAGISALPNTVIQSQAQVNDYAQNNFQNTNDGTHASTEWVATSPNGDDSTYYIDMGINGASWDGTASNSLYDNVGQRDGWVYVQGGNAGGGNLVLGTSIASTYTKIIAGDVSTGDREVARFTSTDVELKKPLKFSDTSVQTTAWLGTYSYNNLTDKPTLVTSYNQLSDLPTLLTSYNELTNKPTLFSGAYAELTGKPTLFSGSYNDLTDKPSAPTINLNDLTDVDLTTPPTAGQVLKYDGTKWAAGTDITSGGAGTDADTLSGQAASYYLNYNNLTNKPTIPTTVTVNGTALTLGSSGTITANTTNALTIGTGLKATASTFDGSAANTVTLDTTVTTIVATAGATTTLSAATLTPHYNITGTIAGTHTIKFPDLTTLAAGTKITFNTAQGVIAFQLSTGTSIVSTSVNLSRQIIFTVLSNAANTTANIYYSQTVPGIGGTGTALATTSGTTFTSLYTSVIDTGGGGSVNMFQSSATVNMLPAATTLSNTLNISTAATSATYSKTLNLFTNLAGGTSTINIGTGVASGTATMNLGSTLTTTTMNGAVTITSLTATNSIVGSITGNAATATKLGTARAINGVNFDGSAAITITASTPNYLTIGSGLVGTTSQFDGSSAVTIAIAQTVALKADTTYVGTTSIALNRSSASQTLTGVSIDGNAATVTNGVYTSGTYSNPSWLTSLAYSKLTGTPSLFSGAYADLTGKPTLYSSAYIGTTNLDFTRSSASQTLTGVSIDGNAATVTNGLYSTGSYADPAWLTSLAYSKLTGAPTVPTNVSQLTNDSGYATVTGAETLTNKTLTLPTIGGTGATFNGSTSGTIILKANATAGTNTLNLPAATGYLVSTGDTGSVTNTMLAGSIANAKLSNSSVTVGTTAISLGASSTTLAGLTSVTSTSFVGALTGNASTVTNGVYTTSTGVVTNTMLAGSIANNKLANSAITVNGTSISLGASATVTAAAGTLTGTTLNSSVVTSSLTSVGTLTGLTIDSAGSTPVSITAYGRPGSTTNTWSFVSNQSVGGPRAWIQFPDSTVQSTAYTGNASTVTNGVYTTDTGTVTNTMLAGSIANDKLSNSSITVNGTSITLGSSGTVTAAAGTLTGTTLNSTVVTSSLTSVGTLTNLSVTNTITGAVSGNAGTATKLATARAINGVDFDGSAAITVTADANTLTGTTLKSTVVSSSLTSVGTLTGLAVTSTSTSSGATITHTPATAAGVALTATGKDTQGGIGYFDFLRATNTTSGATNPSKTFRLNSTGGIEIINSAYSATLATLTDAGAFSVVSTVAATGFYVNNKQAVNGPAFRAYVASGQTITNGSQQKVTFGSETFDTNGNFASSRFTPTVEGYYQLNATVRIAGTSGGGEVMITIWKNGSEYARGTNEGGSEQGSNFYSMQVSDIAYANGTTDYFEIYIQQSSGGSRDTTAGSNISYFSGSMIRGA